ncbi:MAG TPA: 2-hydroxychromene-2-carboxylate isomerase [Paucimonas sp.]|nr:2-hydroxychromene-2-carboxylate isomerase [Paucimonas sp.]HJW55797.1 2-hydroxychromene-2-carboxylate isomerase [Burkholderiaceae bacterium]
MTNPIDFYFDFSSPYGYLAAMQIDALAARHGRSVNWHPLLLGVVFKATGSRPLTTMPMKGDYFFHDFERSARFHDIAYQRPPAFPIATQIPARAMLWVRATLGDAKAVEFAKAAYRAYFVDGIRIDEAAGVAQVASSLGLDPTALSEAIESAPIKAQLRSEVEQAMARGVFGSPFMIVDGESFWGSDRLDQLEAFLKNGSI